MKTIWKIAKTELQSLFYSPIAWLILVIFFIQCAVTFNGSLNGLVTTMELYGRLFGSATGALFAGPRSLYTAVQSNLYLYIPLLTMSLMTREFASGSIKLLYSSPITNRQIILGKYAAMMVYSLIMLACVAVFCILSMFVVDNLDVPYMLTGLLGLYLLMCTYSAVGLFMSCITTYQIVAAICTLTVLFLLSYMRNVGQEIAFVRDLTFWFAINGRVSEFISGLICSEDLFYFILVSTMFIFFTIIKLQADRTKAPWFKTTGKVICVVVVTFILGYISSRPKMMWFYDATETKQNTLTKNSQDIVAKVDDKMTITFYFNILDEGNLVGYGFPRNELVNIKRFKQYVRFKPDIKMKFVRFHAPGNNQKQLDKRYPGLTDEERMLRLSDIYRVDSSLYMKTKADIDAMEPLIKYENYRLSMVLERENGQKTVLRVFNDMYVWPFESEISAAFRRISEKLPRVAFLTGHEERSVRVIADRGYNTFAANKVSRGALINQGFEFVEVNLNEEIPADIKILVMPETKEHLTAVEEANFEKYLNRGGNIIIGSEPRRYDVYKPFLNKYFGVDVCEGQLVSPDTIRVANLTVNWPTPEAAKEIAYQFGTMIRYEQVVSMPTAMGLDYSKAAEKGFTKVVELVKTNDTYWNEKQTTDYVDDVPVLNPDKGEVKKSWVTAIAMSREINGTTQKVVVLGDADCLSNGELGISRRGIRASNFSMVQGLFFWLTDYTTPIDIRRPASSDRSITMGPTGLIVWKVVSFGVIPAVLALCGVLVWIRRKGR